MFLDDVALQVGPLPIQRANSSLAPGSPAALVQRSLTSADRESHDRTRARICATANGFVM